MPGPTEQPACMFAKQFGGELLITFQGADFSNAQVHRARLYLLGHFVPAAHTHADVYARMPSQQPRRARITTRDAGIRPEGHAQSADLMLIKQLDLSPQVIFYSKQGLAALGHYLAKNCQADAATLAVNQGDFKFGLQCLDAFGQGWLGDIQGIRSPAKMAVLDECQQVQQAALGNQNNL
jgi:hypothetical protein